MKRRCLLIISTVLTLPLPAIAGTYEANCFHVGEQKFKSCHVTVDNKAVVTEFKSEKYQDENTSIVGTSIKGIASGNYAQRILSDSGSIAASILLAPLALASSILRKDSQEYVLNINATEDKHKVEILRIKPKDAPEFQQELTLLTKKWIAFEEPENNTLIDVGPNIDAPDINL